jgi:hypothetical protein
MTPGCGERWLEREERSGHARPVAARISNGRSGGRSGKVRRSAMRRKALLSGLLVIALMVPVLLLAPAKGTMALEPPDPRSKNQDGQLAADNVSGTMVAATPESSCKDDGQQTVTDTWSGITFAEAPEPPSKNYDGDAEAATEPGEVVGTSNGVGLVLACGESQGADWYTTSSSFETICQCNLPLPTNGWVFISANGSLLNYNNGPYEANFRIGIDSTSGDSGTDRWVNVYDDGGDGTDKSIALSVLRWVTAGPHTFHFLGKRWSGSSTVYVYDPTLTVIFIPAGETEILPCGVSGGITWDTTSTAFQVIHQCSLTVPQEGLVFISADGSVARSDGEYEARFRMGIDSTSGATDSDRFVNVYDDAGDGTDKSVALSGLRPITAGAHTFYFLGTRHDGTATLRVHDPTLTAIFIPAAATEILPCGASGDADFSTTSSGFQVMRECSLSLPQDGWVFMSGDGSVGRLDGEYEANFRIGIDDTGGDLLVDRWVNVYNDTGDGTDESVALSTLRPIAAGPHTFYLLGKRFTGTGTVCVYDPSVTALFIPGSRLFTPLVLKGW